MADPAALTALVAGHRMGVLATIKADGRPPAVQHRLPARRPTRTPEEFLAAMVDDRRQVVRHHVERLYGQA